MLTNKKIINCCLILIILFSLTGCNNKEDTIENKTKSEIEYLSERFVKILNKFNNITYENYKITAQATKLSKESASEGKTESSSSSQSETAKVAKDDESSDDSKIISSQMSYNSILNPATKDIDWATLKSDMENIYYAWNTILLDLYKLNIANDKILDFSSDLDRATVYIKDEDKKNSILALAKLYEYLSYYSEQILEDNAEKNIIKTKSFIINAYSLVEAADWDNIKGELNKAIESFKLVTTDANFIIDNSYKVNKCYVLLNELNNSANMKDKEIFFIKYKNLMEELSML